MPQNITMHVQALVEAAEREIETLSTHDAIALARPRRRRVRRPARHPRAQSRGRVPGAFHCPRGMLEFWIDPQSKYHKPIFAAGQALRVLLRGRAALGAGGGDRAADGPEAGRAYRRRLRRLEGGRRTGRGAGRQAQKA